MRRPITLALATLLATSLAHADDVPPPLVFEGNEYLSTYTKEVGLEGSIARLGDGKPAVVAGSSMAAFYLPWLSILGAAEGAFGLGGTRQTYDTRAVVRFIWPEPLLSRIFVFAGAGGTVFFWEKEPGEGNFRRGIGPVVAAGFWVQASDKMRFRFEVRDHPLLFGDTDFRHNVFSTLSISTLYR